MSIVVTCPSCGKSAQAPDGAAGKSARCLGCGQSVQIPWEGNAAPAKICADCGVDVSGQKRTKDTAGRYYCQHCWAAKVQAGVAAALPAPGRADQSEELQTLEECADCGLSVPAGELVPDQDGRMVCSSCARNEVDLAPPPLPAPAYAPPLVRPAPVLPAPVLPYRNAPPVQPRRALAAGSGAGHVTQMLIGAGICAIGIVVTVGTYLAAATGGGGRYTIAWGAIVFGGFRFFRGLSGVLGNR